MIARAPEELGAEEEGIVDGAAQRLPAHGRIRSVKIGEKGGRIGSEFPGIVVASSVGEAEIEIGGFAKVAVGAQMADDA